MATPVNGVQQVKAVVTVEEYPQWSVRYGFQLEGERQLEIDEFTSTRNAGVVGEVRNPNLFGRALTGGLFGMYQRNSQDASVFVATSRLFGWRARSTLYGFYERDRILDDAGVDVAGDHETAGRQRRSALAAQAASSSSTAIASSAITPSIREPPTIPFRSTSSPTSRS